MTDLESTLKAAERDFPIGRRVRYFPVLGRSDSFETTIRSKPWAVGDGSIVIALDGRTGGHSILHLEVV
ncbi:hypothetical protein [Fuscovulum blasticum]|uniref:hypothetical protein n=1 Tax=Fuscovulum blasticum TaxID=1075 RepID=UPI000D3E675A|nr:hypothetical protein [Fuscovulum blasticum]AWD21593.1 hypothetical protein B6K69_07830 [Fuscovulum blasticum]